MSNDDGLEIFCDRKKQSIILEMAKADCVHLYDCYGRNKRCLKQAIDYYEEFITVEINTIFERCNSLTEIDHVHECNFALFLQNIGGVEDDGLSMPKKQRKMEEDMYVIYITVQEWWLQGLKGQQFYSIVEIDAFYFTQGHNSSANKAIAHTVFAFRLQTCTNMHSYLLTSQSAHRNGSAPNGNFRLDKIARLRKYGESFATFIAFQNGVEVCCNASNSASIRQFQSNLSEYLIYFLKNVDDIRLTKSILFQFAENKNTATIDCIPTKCTHLLLHKLFYGVSIRYDDYTAQVSVSGGKHNFTGNGEHCSGYSFKRDISIFSSNHS